MIRKEVLSIKKMDEKFLNTLGRRETLRAEKLKLEQSIGTTDEQYKIIHKVFPFTKKITNVIALIHEHDKLEREINNTPKDSPLMANLLKVYAIRRRQIRMAIGGTKS